MAQEAKALEVTIMGREFRVSCTDEERAEDVEVLGHVAGRLLEAHAQHVLDDDLVAEADAEREPVAGRRLHGLNPQLRPDPAGGLEHAWRRFAHVILRTGHPASIARARASGSRLVTAMW